MQSYPRPPHFKNKRNLKMMIFRTFPPKQFDEFRDVLFLPISEFCVFFLLPHDETCRVFFSYGQGTNFTDCGRLTKFRRVSGFSPHELLTKFTSFSYAIDGWISRFFFCNRLANFSIFFHTTDWEILWCFHKSKWRNLQFISRVQWTYFVSFFILRPEKERNRKVVSRMVARASQIGLEPTRC